MSFIISLVSIRTVYSKWEIQGGFVYKETIYKGAERGPLRDGALSWSLAATKMSLTSRSQATGRGNGI